MVPGRQARVGTREMRTGQIFQCSVGLLLTKKGTGREVVQVSRLEPATVCTRSQTRPTFNGSMCGSGLI
jgi:hypothetical protein